MTAPDARQRLQESLLAFLETVADPAGEGIQSAPVLALADAIEARIVELVDEALYTHRGTDPHLYPDGSSA